MDEESPTPPLSHQESVGKNKLHHSDGNLCDRVYMKNCLYPVSSFTLSGYETWVLRRTGATYKGHSGKPLSEADLQIWTPLQKILPLVEVPISVPLALSLNPSHGLPVVHKGFPGALYDGLMQLPSEYRLISWHCWRHAGKGGDSVSLTHKGTGEVIHL